MKQRNRLQAQQADDAKQTARPETSADSDFKLRVNVYRSRNPDAPYEEIEAMAVAGVRDTIDPDYEPRRTAV